MFTKRQQLVMEKLRQRNYETTMNLLAHDVNISDKTLMIEIANINELLFIQEIGEIIKKPGVGIYLNFFNEEKKHILNHLLNNNHLTDMDLLIKYLFVSKKGVIITEKDLEKRLFCTHTYIKKLMDELKRNVKNYNIEIQLIRNYGIQIKGSEFDIRDFIVGYFINSRSFCIENINHRNFLNASQEQQFHHIFMGFQKEPVEKLIKVFEENTNVYLDHISKCNILMHICVSLVRQQNGYLISLNDSQHEFLKNEESLKFLISSSKTVEQFYGMKIPMGEYGYIQLYLDIYGLFDHNSFPLVKSDLMKTPHFDSFKNQFMIIIESILNIDMSIDHDLVEGLISHVAGTIIRLKSSIRIHNPLLNDVKISYSSIYRATWSTSILFDQYFHVTITEDEIAYISLYLGIAREKTVYRVKTCLLCNIKDNATIILLEQIKNIHPSLLVEVISYEQYQVMKPINQWDIIISPLIYLPDSKSIIKTNKILNENDKINILSMVKQLLDYKILHYDLQNINNEGTQFDERFIFLNFEGDNKMLIIERVCKVLQKEGFVSEAFFHSVIEREYKISTEIGALVAVPHGEANYVYKSIIVYINLSKPIIWSEDELVKHIFIPVIANTNSVELESTIKNFYKKLIQLMDHKKMSLFDDLDDPKEVIKIFNNQTY